MHLPQCYDHKWILKYEVSVHLVFVQPKDIVPVKGRADLCMQNHTVAWKNKMWGNREHIKLWRLSLHWVQSSVKDF